MLDLELVTPPSQVGADVVSVKEMKQHLRISESFDGFDAQIATILNEVVAKLHGRDGELNRTIYPCTWKRYLRGFPRCRVIQLPYPPLLEVTEVAYRTADGTVTVMDPSRYIVRKIGTDGVVGEVELLEPHIWPTSSRHARAAAITFRAGYEKPYPHILKRMVKILAAHYFENPEATINEPRQMMINRVVDFGMTDLRAALRVPTAYDDWE